MYALYEVDNWNTMLWAKATRKGLWRLPINSGRPEVLGLPRSSGYRRR